MNLYALKVFVTVVKQGSVSGAAQRLHISQPAVTIQIRNLERELGFSVFKKKGRGIELNEPGTYVYNEAVRLFALENEIENKIKLYMEGQNGSLTIFSTNFPATHFMPHWISQFKKIYPDIKIHIQSGNTTTALEKLSNGEVDLAIIASFHIPNEHEHLEIIKILEDEQCFIVPKGHPFGSRTVNLQQIVEEGFVLREKGSSTRELIFSLFQIHQLPTPIIHVEVNRIEEAIMTVAGGYGMTLAPKKAVIPYIEMDLVEVVDVRGVNLKRHINLCTLKSSSPSPSAKNFMSLLCNQR
ncbi:LysR family transcriptional regulator [Bacillus sp. 31A1R]|uniref:LysR family transcriptional regulator n=1 Tax=Robertmurraya mangrovi TaxID=3098077 RepID=A0ABU5ITG1_9BACI|nr:LysR family transcriptional regulator [Bacillus sp. 31A1R]MDZ5470447.1 LysR family transcriptional regulator [Bacillus sp. 31A1R]